jgi:hypothetical protein
MVIVLKLLLLLSCDYHDASQKFEIACLFWPKMRFLRLFSFYQRLAPDFVLI